MARDERTKFEQLAELNKRPAADVAAVAQLNLGGKLHSVRSWAPIVGPDELVAVLRTDTDVIGYRLNPEVALNLAFYLLEIGKRQGWWEIDLSHTAPHTN